MIVNNEFRNMGRNEIIANFKYRTRLGVSDWGEKDT